jgi:uncharacterized protein YidB (DUF937 family)
VRSTRRDRDTRGTPAYAVLAGHVGEHREWQDVAELECNTEAAMGMLDELLGGLMQGRQGGGAGQSQGGGMPGLPGGLGAAGGGAILAVVLQLLQQSGGLQGLLRQMQQSGHGDEAQSWIGTGQNRAIPPDVLSQIFGSGQLAQIAQQLGMSQDDASTHVAQALPDVVDRMTPQGNIPDASDDLVSRTLEELMRGRR